MPREMRCAAGDEMYRGRRVGSGRHIGRRGIRGKTEWGKGVPLTITPPSRKASPRCKCGGSLVT